MKKYVCDVCGYIYDEATGDPDNGIEFRLPAVRSRKRSVFRN